MRAQHSKNHFNNEHEKEVPNTTIEHNQKQPYQQQQSATTINAVKNENKNNKSRNKASTTSNDMSDCIPHDVFSTAARAAPPNQLKGRAIMKA